MLCVMAAGKQKDTDKGKYLETSQFFPGHTQQGPSSSHFLRMPLYASIQERCPDGFKPSSFTCLSVIHSTCARIKFQYLNILGDIFKYKTITVVKQDMKIPWGSDRGSPYSGWASVCLWGQASQSLLVL